MRKLETIVELETEDSIDFAFHVEGDEMIIDRCEGTSPEQALGIFPAWAIELAHES